MITLYFELPTKAEYHIWRSIDYELLGTYKTEVRCPNSVDPFIYGSLFNYVCHYHLSPSVRERASRIWMVEDGVPRLYRAPEGESFDLATFRQVQVDAIDLDCF